MFPILKDFLAPVISFGALIVAGLSLRYTLRNARKNIQLSIQQAVIKMAIEKAKDCNAAWDKSKKLFDDLEANGVSVDKKEHYDVISELLISKEIILKSFSVYSKQDKHVIERKEDYAYIFWKQLNTAVRVFFTSDAVKIALAFNHKTTYGNQLLEINDFVKNIMKIKVLKHSLMS